VRELPCGSELRRRDGPAAVRSWSLLARRPVSMHPVQCRTLRQCERAVDRSCCLSEQLQPGQLLERERRYKLDSLHHLRGFLLLYRRSFARQLRQRRLLPFSDRQRLTRLSGRFLLHELGEQSRLPAWALVIDEQTGG
jgi:hypothetical protein